MFLKKVYIAPVSLTSVNKNTMKHSGMPCCATLAVGLLPLDVDLWLWPLAIEKLTANSNPCQRGSLPMAKS